MKLKIKKAIPNIITMSRIIAIIIGMIYFIKNKFLFSILFYAYGAISDMFDGYFARRLDAYSNFGKYLDAISDKLYLLSIIILSIIKGNYFVIIPAIMEAIISIINYITIIKRKNVYTERVGKFKTAVEFPMMITALLATKVNGFYYVFIVLFILTLYFQIQSIMAYINQLNNKTKEVNVSFEDKKVYEKIILLLKEFISYIIHPVIIK